ncbi:adenylate/guanylate cyclase domain-containing protein, partial [bacterium]|nr:adenylate/guanylate cyclase domain-containing protein [bacterium]
ITAEKMLSPLPQVLETAKSLGHINIIPDIDGVVRKIPLVIKYGDRVYLSLGCQMAADHLRIPQNKVSISEKEVILDKIHIPVNKRGEMLINYGPGAGFKRYSFLEILQSFRTLKEGKIPSLNLSDFKDKLVLVGVTASGASDIRATPFSSISPMLETHGQIASNIFRQSFLIKASKLQNLLFFLPFCFLMGLLSYSRPQRTPFIFLGSLATYGFFGFLLFKFAGIWIDLVSPGLAVSFSFIGFVSYQLGKRVLEGLSLKERVILIDSLKKGIKEDFSREATLLDIDIANATAIKEAEDDYNVIYTFGSYHQLLDTIARKDKGELFDRAGDGVIYRFQAPDQAIKVAIRIKEALVNFNENVNRLKKPIRVRMGINSGELLMDGREGKGEVFSRTIDITGHLQKEAKPGEIMITEETFKDLKEPGLFEEAGYLERDGVKIYRYRNSSELEGKN